MSDTTTVDVETDGGMPPPPDFDDDVEVDEGVEAGAESDPDGEDDLDGPGTTSDAMESLEPPGGGRRRRGRHKDSRGRPFQAGYMSGGKPLPWEDKTLEWDGWVDVFPWGTDSTLRLVLKRLAPTRGPNGVEISGVLETRETAPIHLEEIRATYGGGEYEASIVGMHPRSKETRPRVLARRRVRIPGLPNTAELPRNIAMSRAGSSDPIAKTAMDLVRDEVTNLRRRGEESPRLAEKTIDTMKEVSEHRVKAAEVAADARVEIILRQLDEQRQRNIDLERRLRDTETEIVRKTAENQKELTSAVAEVQTSSLSTIMQLIPTLSGKSDEQVRQMATMYQAREERLAADYKAQLQQQQNNFQMQYQAQQTLGQAQLETVKGQYEHTIALLQNELQLARAEVASSRREVEHLRTILDQKNQDLLNKIAEAKQTKSLTEQLIEVSSAKEALDGLFGGGASPSDDDGIENPLTRKLLKMGEGIIQNAPGILEAIKSRGAPGPMGPQPGYPPPGYPPPGYQLAQAQAPQQPVMRRRSAPPTANPTAAPTANPVAPSPPPPSKRVKREDVETALSFIANVLESGGGNPPSPTDVAQAALSKADHGMLKALSSRKPESVIEQLEAQGMLKGPLTTDEGKKYLTDLLTAFKTHFETPAA